MAQINTTLETAIGEVQAAPTANTILARLKEIADRLCKGEYETVAASQTAQVLGATGAAGDSISRLILIPANLNPGAVALLDNATSITLFAGGTGSITELKPIVIDLDMVSVSGAWKLTTGADVAAIAVGNFT